MTVMSVARFERFFRVAAGLDVDKEDLKRYSEFVSHKLHDLLIVGQATASANDRDVIEPSDLPVTKGLQETIHQFRAIEEEVELRPILEELATVPPLERSVGDSTRERFPEIIGGLSLALARAFVLVDPKLTNPASRHWERAFRVFDLLL